jgi:hypothetical protein
MDTRMTTASLPDNARNGARNNARDGDSPSDDRRLDRRNLAVSMLGTLAAILIAWPFAEGGSCDDFSYIHMAKTLAETGRFAYNGWPTAMLGIQVWWGAAWIWLFGFSFTIARLSLLPLAVGAVGIVYLLARRTRLSPADGLFVALATGLSPWFISLAPTFMTDVSSLFFLMASLYGFVRAVEAAEQDAARSRYALAWLAVGMLCGVLGGTIRQTVWFAPLAGSAVLFLWPRVRPLVRLAALLCGGIGLASIVIGMRWFASQPYAIPTQPLTLSVSSLSQAAGTVRQVCLIVAGGMAAAMPVFAWCLPAWKRWHRERPPWPGSALVADAVIVAAMGLVVFVSDFSRMLTIIGLPVDAGGLSSPWMPMIRSLRIGLLVAFALAVVGVLVRQRTAVGIAIRRMPPALLITLVYLVAYSAVLLQATKTTGSIFGRYYLPYIPIVSYAILFVMSGVATATASRDRNRSAWGWALLAIIAAYGVGTLHDSFAECRVRLAAVESLERAGIPRQRIMAGWEIDGWEQIERVGFMNDPRIRVPPDAYQPWKPDGYPENLFLRQRLPSLTPEYIVAGEGDQFSGTDARLESIPFTAWLPPFRRAVVVSHQQPMEVVMDGPKDAAR